MPWVAREVGPRTQAFSRRGQRDAEPSVGICVDPPAVEVRAEAQALMQDFVGPVVVRRRGRTSEREHAEYQETESRSPEPE